MIGAGKSEIIKNEYYTNAKETIGIEVKLIQNMNISGDHCMVVEVVKGGIRKGRRNKVFMGYNNDDAWKLFSELNTFNKCNRWVREAEE